MVLLEVLVPQVVLVHQDLLDLLVLWAPRGQMDPKDQLVDRELMVTMEPKVRTCRLVTRVRSEHFKECTIRIFQECTIRIIFTRRI